jgi:steroid 5-alpha reductase family enzyme
VSITDLSLTPVVWVGFAVFMLWLLSVASRDASIVDVFWGLGFVLIAALSNASEGYAPRQAIVGLLVSLWGIRLAVHLLLRNRGKGEDPRYKAMRKHWGNRFPVVSLVTVFALQGTLMVIVSLPIQAAMHAATPAELTPFDIGGAIICLAGIAWEATADLQLTRFRSKRGNGKKVLDTGLWRYSRHPNYFGDCVAWWGFGLIAVAVEAWWALIGPALMTFLLVRVSGVALLERRIVKAKKRPDYESYIERTSAFVPMPPRKTVEIEEKV